MTGGYVVEVPGRPELYLQAGDLRPARGVPALEVLGEVRRPDGQRGALCRTLAGQLVQRNAGTVRNLPQREAEAALAAAVAARREELQAAG